MLLVYMGVYKSSYSPFNPLPDDKILDWSKLKQIAEYILQCISAVWGRKHC